MKLRLAFLALTFLVLQAASASAPSAQAQGFSCGNLLDLVGKRDIQSIDQLVPALPKSYRENFTLVYDTKSLQGADRKNPRAVLFGEDGKTIMTFNGHPSQKGYRNLELLCWSDQSKGWELREITFPVNGKGKPEVSEANPSRCLQCHASHPKPFGKPKPIMSQYFRWKGMFGSVDDAVYELDTTKPSPTRVRPEEMAFLNQEGADFLAFRELAKNHPRYKALFEGREAEKYFPYHQEKGGDEISFSLGGAPNTRLTDLLFSRQMDQVFERIKNSNLFKRYRYTLAMGALCQHKVDADFKEKAKAHFEKERDQLAAKGLALQDSGSLNFEMAQPEYSFTPKILDFLGIVAWDEWSLDLGFPRDTAQHPGYTTGLPQTASWLQMKRNFQKELLSEAELAACEPPAALNYGYKNETAMGADYLKRLQAQWGVPNCKDRCDEYKALAKVELSQPGSMAEQICSDGQTAPSLESMAYVEGLLATLKDKALTPQERCASCHSETDPDRRIGPYIPFHRPEELRKTMDDWTETHIDLLVSDSEKQVFEGGRRMPFGQKPLSADERKTLLDFLRRTKEK